MTAIKTKNLYELLRNKQILAILDGDTDFGELDIDDGEVKIKISMPYLSGPDICGISNIFGLPVSYGWGGGAKSRWSYLDDLFEHCIKNHKESELLCYLFSKSQFADTLKGNTPVIIEEAYKKIISTIIEKINGILCFGGNELYISGKQFLIRSIASNVNIETPTVKQIDRTYIKELSERALRDISEMNFDSAITKSRTLLEEIFCYVIEQKNEVPSHKGDFIKLYGQVKTLYNMHQHKEHDNRINMLLSGFEKIFDLCNSGA